MKLIDLEAVAAALSLPEHDLLVVADGSGTKLDFPCGWACYLADLEVGKVWTHLGGTSAGTNNYAELAPFVHALWHWHCKHFAVGGKDRPVGVRVELVSDSEVTVRCGNGLYTRNANLPLWASIDWFAANGYRLHWNHLRRNTMWPHKETDRIGREVRNLFETYVYQMVLRS